MEIECEDGSRISIKTDSETEFGRGSGFPINDRTVSRRHVSFKLHPNKNPNSETRFSFQVLGKNPVWVSNSENGETRVYRKSERGELGVGDSFCVSAKNAILFKLKRSEGEEAKDEEMEESVASGVEGSDVDEELGFGSVELKDIDPVKEFGFLVMGHEFDYYPKSNIRAISNWNWFLEEARVDSDTETNTSKGKKGVRRKKKDGGYDDEEWTGESEDEKEVISKVKKGKRPRYTTRSKDSNKSPGDSGSRKKFEQKKIVSTNEDDKDDGDEDEDTLGGFIVGDEELEEEYNEDEEEEVDDESEDEDD